MWNKRTITPVLASLVHTLYTMITLSHKLPMLFHSDSKELGYDIFTLTSGQQKLICTVNKISLLLPKIKVVDVTSDTLTTNNWFWTFRQVFICVFNALWGPFLISAPKAKLLHGKRTMQLDPKLIPNPSSDTKNTLLPSKVIMRWTDDFEEIRR